MKRKKLFLKNPKQPLQTGFQLLMSVQNSEYLMKIKALKYIKRQGEKQTFIFLSFTLENNVSKKSLINK